MAGNFEAFYFEARIFQYVAVFWLYAYDGFFEFYMPE